MPSIAFSNVKFKNDAKKKLKKIVNFFEARLAFHPLTKIHNNLNPLRITTGTYHPLFGIVGLSQTLTSGGRRNTTNDDLNEGWSRGRQ